WEILGLAVRSPPGRNVGDCRADAGAESGADRFLRPPAGWADASRSAGPRWVRFVSLKGALMSVDVAAPQRSPSPPASLTTSSVRLYLELFLISFAILFFELGCIRWFGSMVVYLTFFTNIVLMACFLGMSVGCLASSRSQRFIVFTIPLALVSVILTA